MRRLVNHYIKKESFVLFVYDCSDKDRLREALLELQSNMQMMREAEARHLWIVLNKQDLIPSSRRNQAIGEIRQQFQTAIATHGHQLIATVTDLPGLSAKTGAQLKELMDDIQQRLNAKAKTSRPDKSSVSESPPAAKEENAGISQEELLSRIQKANSIAEDAETFWVAFGNGQLETWDHYNHLRAGYFVLLESLASGQGVIACSDSFIEHLERLRASNPQRFRNTTHQTMTVFWVMQLWYCTKTYQATNHMHDLPQREDFGKMLLQSPTLLDSQLWKQYYTKEMMFSPEAKDAWCPPTLKPLPAFIPSDEESTTTGHPATTQGESWRLLEFGFNVAQEILQSSKRRGVIVKEALDSLQTSTIQLRIQDATVAPYSETQAYFWIQMAHAALQSVNDDHADLSTMEFSQFREEFRFTETDWRRYYSTELWESIPARMGFVNPDLKPLPNVIPNLSKQ